MFVNLMVKKKMLVYNIVSFLQVWF